MPGLKTKKILSGLASVWTPFGLCPVPLALLMSLCQPTGRACCTDAAAFALQKAFFITFVAIFTVLCALLAVTMRYRGDTSLKPLPKGELKKRVVAQLQKLTEEMIRAEKAAHCKNLTKEKKATAKRKPKKQIEEETQQEAAARWQKLTGEDRAAAGQKARKQVEKEHKKLERRKQHLLYWARALGCATIFLSLALLTSPAPTCLFRKGDTNDSYIPRYASACICTTFLFILSAFAQLDGVVTPPAPDTSDKKMQAEGRRATV